MHPDFNPKFSHLKPLIVFFTLSTKDAQPAAMCVRQRSGAGRSSMLEFRCILVGELIFYRGHKSSIRGSDSVSTYY